MSDSSSQQKANLARIRDNQRRSRARRKEYLQELETKYRTCEAVGVEASAEIQAAARRVLDENKRLRHLLRQVGISDDEIDRSLYEGREKDESQSSFIASGLLDSMMATRKPCKSSSAGGCGEGSACKVEDEGMSRRQSCASTPSSQQTLKPTIAPRSTSSGPSTQEQPDWALAAPPPPPPQQQQQHREQEPTPSHAQQTPLQPIQQSSAQQSQPPLQYQSSHLPPQQQHFISPPQPHSLSIPVAPAHASPASYTPTYPIYAPQAYAYAPSAQLLDWGLSTQTATAPYTTPSDTGTYTSPTSVASVPTYPYASQGYAGPDTSSCFTAADAVRAMNPGAGQEVEAALGCTDNGHECRVNNAVVFEVMDRYSGV